MLSRQLGEELVDTGISVISLYPGIVDTAMQADIRNQPVEKVGQELADRFHDYHTSRLLSTATPVGKIIADLAGEAGENFQAKVITISDPAVQALLQD